MAALAARDQAGLRAAVDERATHSREAAKKKKLFLLRKRELLLRRH